PTHNGHRAIEDDKGRIRRTYGRVLHSHGALIKCGTSRWGVLELSRAEKNPLNLNQVMLAEEVRDGKGISMPAIDIPFTHGRNTIEGMTRGQIYPSGACGPYWTVRFTRIGTGRAQPHHLYL